MPVHKLDSKKAEKKEVNESIIIETEQDCIDTVILDEDNLNSLKSMKSLGIQGSNNIFTQKFSMSEILDPSNLPLKQSRNEK